MTKKFAMSPRRESDPRPRLWRDWKICCANLQKRALSAELQLKLREQSNNITKIVHGNDESIYNSKDKSKDGQKEIN